MAAGVKNLSQHDGCAHDQRGNEDPDDDAGVGRGGCGTAGGKGRRAGAAGGRKEEPREEEGGAAG